MAERVTALEVQQIELIAKVDDIGNKIDDLIAIRNKGMGAFWLASSLVGSGIVATLAQLFHWWR